MKNASNSGTKEANSLRREHDPEVERAAQLLVAVAAGGGQSSVMSS